MITEMPGHALHGIYRDRLFDARGHLLWDRGPRSNVIVADCRRLLAGFMLGAPNTLGVQALAVGTGSDTWDDQPGPPPPQATDVDLVDPQPHAVPLAELDIRFLDPNSDATSLVPTNRIQIRATLGPNVPPWPDAAHPTGTLREFGLLARLDGTDVLINNVRHTAIAKDPASTLERTIWLVF